MSKKIATITLNPAYDLVGLCRNIELGTINQVKTAGLHAAGKGINVAKVLRDLDIDVTSGGFLGSDNLDGFQSLFNNFGIVNRFKVVPGRTRINVKLTEKNSKVTDFNFSGFEVTQQDWKHFVNDSLSWIYHFDMVVVSGSLPSGLDLDMFSDWMSSLRARCARIIFDSSHEALVAGLKAIPWLVKPNLRELEIWRGYPLTGLTDIVSAAQALRKKGITHVVISLGAQGALWVSKRGSWIAKPPPCKVISTVGAGDAMVGGLIYGLLMHKSIEHTLQLATAIATLAVSQSNVGVTNRLHLDSIMTHIDVQPFHQNQEKE